jgi:hypothetical protein
LHFKNTKVARTTNNTNPELPIGALGGSSPHVAHSELLKLSADHLNPN